jgi:hypothetical protein
MDQFAVTSGSFGTDSSEFITAELMFIGDTEISGELSVAENPFGLEFIVNVIDNSGTMTQGPTAQFPGLETVNVTIPLPSFPLPIGKYRLQIRTLGGRVAGSYNITSTLPPSVVP